MRPPCISPTIDRVCSSNEGTVAAATEEDFVDDILSNGFVDNADRERPRNTDADDHNRSAMMKQNKPIDNTPGAK